jgi:hypothetical protein
MTRTAIAVTLLLLSAHLRAAEVTRAGPYTFHSSFWINLHETLMHHAMARRAPDLTALPANDAEAWRATVDVYRKNKSGWNINFDRPMAITHDVLTQFGDEVAAPTLREPLGPALLQAAPIYRRHFWPADDRANRFWIGYAAAMIRDAGEDLARAHAKAYGVPWPESVRVDAAAHAGPFGAYTMMGQLAGVHETVSSRAAGNAGLSALEVVFHEASHALVAPAQGRVAEAIKKHADRLGIEPPPDLWHAIIFATSSELTRRALRERGADGYTPMVYDLYARAWPHYREPIEKYWLGYLDGALSFDEAIGKIVEAAPKAHDGPGGPRQHVAHAQAVLRRGRPRGGAGGQGHRPRGEGPRRTGRHLQPGGKHPPRGWQGQGHADGAEEELRRPRSRRDSATT